MRVNGRVVNLSPQDANLPITQKLKIAIKKLIEDGTFPPGSPLPSTRELSDENQISPLTARNAYQALATEGIIKTFHGKGSYVNDTEELNRESVEYDIHKTLASVGDNLKSLGYSTKEQKDIVETVIKQKIDNELESVILKGFENGLSAKEILDISIESMNLAESEKYYTKDK